MIFYGYLGDNFLYNHFQASVANFGRLLIVFLLLSSDGHHPEAAFLGSAQKLWSDLPWQIPIYNYNQI